MIWAVPSKVGLIRCWVDAAFVQKVYKCMR